MPSRARTFADKANLGISNQTGTTYTFVLSDADEITTFSNSSATTVTVPTNANVAYEIGTVLNVIQIGAGQVTFVGDTGVTINSERGLKIKGQYGVVACIKRNTDTWVLAGNTEA